MILASINKRLENTGFGRMSGRIGNAAIPLSILTPVITESIKNFIPGGETSKAGRTVGAAVSGIGDIASYAATGSLFGPLGTAI
ncbi:hypothetical protein EBR77_04415, partial [bacterium]|nr:hypothetical protein [bacterium]